MAASRDDLDVIRTKLAPPARGSLLIPRPALLDLLDRATKYPVIAIIAPAGYGKTAIAAMWARREGRHVAWYTADARDDDPATLLRGLTAAICQIGALDPDVIDAVAHPGESIWTRAVARLGAATQQLPPFVLVVDDMDQIPNVEALEAVVTLARHLPEGSQLVVIGRTRGALPLSRLVSKGQLFLIGPAELELDRREIVEVGQTLGIGLDDASADALQHRTEGWATGVYLSLLGAGHEAPGPRPTGPDMLGDYIASEVLGRLSARDVDLVLRTSVLERLNSQLCDEILGRRDSARVLERLELTSGIIIPLDQRRSWFRYHNLIAELLAAELDRQQPGARARILARASAWHERTGDRETALEYAFTAGDEAAAARLLVELGQSVFNAGRIETLRRWFAFFEKDEVMRRYPVVAALGAVTFGVAGDSERADLCLELGREAPIPTGDAGNEVAGILAYARGVLCREGPEAMLRDGEFAMAMLPIEHPYRVGSMMVRGSALRLLDRSDEAKAIFLEALDLWSRFGRANSSAIVILIGLAWIAESRHEWAEAERLVARARGVAIKSSLTRIASGALVDAASARLVFMHGASSRARDDLAQALRARTAFGYAIPWWSVGARLDMMRAALGLGDAAAAHALADEIDEILTHRPDLGTLNAEAAQLNARARALPAAKSGATSLTSAELRLLPLLTTHLSFAEIGARLAISRNTVKTQAKSLYRRLEADSRGQAVALAVQRGLLELPSPAR